MYNAVFIPSAKLILFSGLATVVIYFVIKKLQQWKNKKLDKLMSSTMTLFGVMFLSSLIYSSWDMEKFISRLTMMKLILVLFGIKGNVSERRLHPRRNLLQKKRGNQRIEEQPNKSYFEKRTEEKGRIERGEVRIILGASTDNDDN